MFIYNDLSFPVWHHYVHNLLYSSNKHENKKELVKKANKTIFTC